MKRWLQILYEKPFLLFILFVAITYFPVLLPFFHLKNDLITQNLPTRFVISESIYSGYFPWWNPYIHFGIPQYGDMNNGFWNPVLWLFATTVGYNIWTITIEEMLYILIGGWGVYKLCKEFYSKESSLVVALSYMACGYTVGHLQHFCWITGTAYFPFTALYYVRTLKMPVVKNFIYTALSFFFFLSATHPGLIIGALYFFSFTVIYIFLYRRSHASFLYQRRFWSINLTLILLILMFSMVVIVSDADVIRHISRGEKLTKGQMLMNPTTLQSYISLLFPLAVQKTSFWKTDISMRNVYMGLGVLAGLITTIYYYRKRIFQLLPPLLFFILLSAGGSLKVMMSKVFPLIGYVRMNGEFTYFTIIILLLIAGKGLDISVKKNKSYFAAVNTFSSFSSRLILLMTIASLVTAIFYAGAGIELSSFTSYDAKLLIKNLIDTLPLGALVAIECSIQLLTILLIKTSKNKTGKQALIIAANLIIHTWLILPFTGLGMRSKKQFNDSISTQTKGIHAPELKSIKSTRYLPDNLFDQVMLLSSYSKKVGYWKEETYPVQLKSSRNFFSDSATFNFITNQSYIFLSTDTVLANTSFDSSIIKVLRFSPGHLKIEINQKGYQYLTFLQNNYPYWAVKIDGARVEHFTGYKTFITTVVPEGAHTIEFTFEPKPIKFALIFSLLIISFGIILLLSNRWSNTIFFR